MWLQGHVASKLLHHGPSGTLQLMPCVTCAGACPPTLRALEQLPCAFDDHESHAPPRSPTSACLQFGARTASSVMMQRLGPEPSLRCSTSSLARYPDALPPPMQRMSKCCVMAASWAGCCIAGKVYGRGDGRSLDEYKYIQAQLRSETVLHTLFCPSLFSTRIRRFLQQDQENSTGVSK